MAIAKRRKRFFNVELPLIKKETQLQGYELSDLNNRYIKYDLTRLLKGKSAILTLKINVNGDNYKIIPIEIKLMPYFLKRMVRKGTDYVEDSFSTKCKNNKLTIKPFLVTRKKVSKKIRKALREKAREELINYVKDKNSETIFEEILKNQMQKQLSVKLKKIYPLSLCEIRILKVENNSAQ